MLLGTAKGAKMSATNWGWIKSGTMDLDPFVTFTNFGMIFAYGGNDITLGGGFAFEQDFDTLINQGAIVAERGSTIKITATVHQVGTGSINIWGGKVILDGSADGGIIRITDGTLAWGRLTRGPAPEGAGTTSPIAFLSQAGAIDTGVVGITEAFNAARQDIAVFSPANPFGAPPVQIADLHLTGRTYAAADFSVHGSAIVFDPIHA